jgi:hypothetical protein
MVSNRINIIQNGLTGSQYAESHLQQFCITANAHGAVTISCSRNGVQTIQNIQVNYTNNGATHTFDSPLGLFQSLNDTSVIIKIGQTGVIWNNNINNVYRNCIIQAVRQELGQNVDVIFQ